MGIHSTDSTDEQEPGPTPSPSVRDGVVPQVRDVAHPFGYVTHVNAITEVREQTISRDVLGLFESFEDAGDYVEEFGTGEIPLPAEHELARRVTLDYITPTGEVPGDNPRRWGSPFIDGEAGKQLAVAWVDVEAAARMVVQNEAGNVDYDPEWLTLTDCGVGGYVLTGEDCGVIISPIVGESSRPLLRLKQ